MRKILTFIAVGTFILIIADSFFVFLQSLIFGERADIEFSFIYLMFTICLFQWVFVLALVLFYFLRSKLNIRNFHLGWLVGSLISFTFYSFYWLVANEGDVKTLRLIIINSLLLGFIMVYLYNKIILNNKLDS
jgi:hypothetical protein